MIDRQQLASFRLQIRSLKDVLIDQDRDTDGVVRALFFSTRDRCFYVTVNGRERLRSDSPDTICDVFNNVQVTSSL